MLRVVKNTLAVSAISLNKYANMQHVAMKPDLFGLHYKK
jgi:hypothetical protein